MNAFWKSLLAAALTGATPGLIAWSQGANWKTSASIAGVSAIGGVGAYLKTPPAQPQVQ